MMVSFTSLASLALAATAGTSPAVAAPSVPAVVSHSVTVDSTYALTEDQLKSYIAVKQALGPYWKAHQPEFKANQAADHKVNVSVGGQKLAVGVFNYPEIVKKDAAVATIFTSNKFSPDKFEPTQVAAFEAVGALTIAEASKSALPANTTTLGKNVELVKAHQEELKAVGIALQVQGGGMGGGMGGGNDDLNP